MINELKLNKVEVIILTAILIENGYLEGSLAEIYVLERCYTGVGVFSEFAPHPSLHIGGEDRTCGVSSTVLINGEILTGHLYYIKDGFIETIEGYTYHSAPNIRPPWPEEIETAEDVTSSL